MEEHLQIEVAVQGMLAEVGVVRHSSSTVELVELVVGEVVEMSAIVQRMLVLLVEVPVTVQGMLVVVEVPLVHF